MKKDGDSIEVVHGQNQIDLKNMNVIAMPEAELVEQNFTNFKEDIKKRKHRSNYQRDIEIFIVANQCKLDVNEDIHILYLISDLMDKISKQSDDAWSFRYIKDDKYYWQNKDKTLKTHVYPFLSDVNERIQILKTQSENLRGHQIQQFLKEDKVGVSDIKGVREQETMNKIKQEKMNFTRDVLIQFVQNRENNLYAERLKEQMEDDPDNIESLAYDLRPLAQFLSNRLAKEQLLDVIYFCPFNLDQQQLKIIDEELSVIQLQNKEDSASSDSGLSSYNSYQTVTIKKRIDPHQLLLRNKRSTALSSQRSQEERKSLIKPSINQVPNTTKHQKNDYDQSSQFKSAIDIMEKRKHQSSQYMDDFDSRMRSQTNKRQGSKDSLHTLSSKDTPNQRANIETLENNNAFRPQTNSTDDQMNKKELSQENKKEAQKNEGSVYTKIEQYFKAKIKTKDGSQTNNQDDNSNQRKDPMGILSIQSYQDQINQNKRKSLLMQSNPRRESKLEPEYRELNFKSVGILRRKKSTEPTFPFQSDYLSPHKISVKRQSKAQASPRSFSRIHEIKQKLMDKNSKDYIVQRFKQLLRHNHFRPEKFDRMLKYYNSEDELIAKKFKKLLLKTQMIKIFTESINPNEIMRKIKEQSDLQKVQNKSSTINHNHQSKDDQPDEGDQKDQRLMSLLKIIDKNKFSLDKNQNQQSIKKQDDSLDLFDEENNIKFEVYDKLADENFEDLNVTLEFQKIIDNYREKAEGKKRKLTKDGDSSRRNSLVDIAGLMFVKNQIHNQRRSALNNNQDQNFSTQSKIVNIIRGKFMETAENIQSQQLSDDNQPETEDGDYMITERLRKRIQGIRENEANMESKEEGKVTTFSSNSNSYLTSSLGTESSHSSSQSSKKSVNDFQDEQRGSASRTQNLKLDLNDLHNLKHVLGETSQQQLQEFFKIENNTGSRSNKSKYESAEILKQLQVQGFRLKRQQDLVQNINQDIASDLALGQSEFQQLRDSPNIRNRRSNGLKTQQILTSYSLASKDDKECQPSVSGETEIRLTDENQANEDLVNNLIQTSDYYKENSDKNDLIQDPSSLNYRKSRLSLKNETQENVIHEVYESDSSLDLEQFKNFQQQIFQSTRQSLASSQEALSTISQATKPYLKSILRFKAKKHSEVHQEAEDQIKHKNDNNKVNGQEQKGIFLTSRLFMRRGSYFENVVNASRKQFQKFALNTDPNSLNTTQKNFNLASLELKHEQIDQLVSTKRENFLYYCKSLGNPQSHPRNLTFQENFTGMTPFHIMRMGQALGLLKIDRRNESFLLWIAQQALAQNVRGELAGFISYEDKIQLMLSKEHPGYEYFKFLIYWQRKIFNQSLLKQLNPDKFRKDCSWLALTENVLDSQSQLKIGERIYYYNFYSHQKSLIQPEELFLHEPEHYLFESFLTMERTSQQRTGLTQSMRSSVDDRKNYIQMERTFDASILKSIKDILQKRSKMYSLQIDRKPTVKLTSNKTLSKIQNDIGQPQKAAIKKKVSMKWTKHRLALLSERGSADTTPLRQGYQTSYVQSLRGSESLPNLLMKSQSSLQNSMSGKESVQVVGLSGSKVGSRERGKSNQQKQRQIKAIIQNPNNNHFNKIKLKSQILLLKQQYKNQSYKDVIYEQQRQQRQKQQFLQNYQGQNSNRQNVFQQKVMILILISQFYAFWYH